MNRSLRLVALLSLSMMVSACARSSAPPLPGDSVAADGAVTLSPPRFSTTSTSRTSSASSGNAAEPLGPIESRLFPAELVMDHQSDIALEPAQREAITKEVTRTQAELVRLQWELASEKDKLVSVLDTPKVDEAKSKAAAAELMDRENKIKAVHLAMLVRIKNLLTPAQQDKLRASREAERCAPPAAAADAGPPDAGAGRPDAHAGPPVGDPLF
jgi:Spy/CpxP family protein refolding chaperone